MRKKLYIIGAGGLGREVLSIAREIQSFQNEWEIEGFLNSKEYMNALDDIDTNGYVICESIEEHIVSNDNVYVFAIADCNVKEKLCLEFLKKGANFINLIHNTARLGYTTKIGKGNVIYPFTTISENAIIGDFVTVNSHTSIAHDASIGNFTTISAHCDITGSVKIGKKVFLGTSVAIVPKCKIGDDAFLCAGSVVMNSVRVGKKVLGNPARYINI